MRRPRATQAQDGFVATELALGVAVLLVPVAALGIAALVAIWAVLQTLGLDIIDWIRGQLRV